MQVTKNINYASSSTNTAYICLPFGATAFTIRDAKMVLEGNPGSSMDVTLKKSSTTVGKLSPGASVSAGALVSYTKDSSNGNTVFNRASSDTVKIVTDNASTAVTAALTIDFDEFKRT